MQSFVRVTSREGGILIQLGSPDGFPRLTRAVLSELHAIFERAAASASRPRAILLAGTEQAFAAGADLEEVSALNATEAKRFSELGQSLMNRVESFPAPVVAAIRGYCLGGGFDLAMACHIRVAAADATFGHPGGSLGILTGWGGTLRLPRIVGRAHAVELLTTGRTFEARDAYAMKLVSRVVAPDALMETAWQLAQAAAAKGLTSLPGPGADPSASGH